MAGAQSRSVRPGASVGLVHNPRSGRNAVRGPLELGSGGARIRRRDASTAAEIARAAIELARDAVDVIAINGGDGTLQAALTGLLRREAGTPRPLIAALPAGTTNMSAADIGMRGDPARALRRVLDWAGGAPLGAEIVTRPVLRVAVTPDAPPLYGMFFGAGAIYQGVLYTHQRLYPLGLRGEYGPGLALARFVLAMLRGQRHLVAPVLMGVGVGGEPLVTRPSVLLLVSALRRLFLGLRPYWGAGDGALRYTQVYAQPRHLLRALPAMLRGRANRFVSPEHGYVSRNVDTVRMTLEGGFTLDGELYLPQSATTPLVLSNGGEVDFIRV